MVSVISLIVAVIGLIGLLIRFRLSPQYEKREKEKDLEKIDKAINLDDNVELAYQLSKRLELLRSRSKDYSRQQADNKLPDA